MPEIYPKYAVKPIVPEEVYTDRQEFIEEEPEHPHDLIAFVEKHITLSKGFRVAVGLMKAIERGEMALPRATIKQYKKMERQINDQKGYLCMSQILWNGQGRTFPGQYFHSKDNVAFSDRFHEIRHRLRLDASSEKEVDVYAFADDTIWLCESKWWETHKVGRDVVEKMLGLAEKLRDFEGREYFEGENPMRLCLWLFAHNGVTQKAKTLLDQHGIYWSARADLDALIQLAGLRKLPDIKS